LDTPDESHRFNITDGNHGGVIKWPEPESPYSSMSNLDSYNNKVFTMHLEAWTRYPEDMAFTGESIHIWMPDVDY